VRRGRAGSGGAEDADASGRRGHYDVAFLERLGVGVGCVSSNELI